MTLWWRARRHAQLVNEVHEAKALAMKADIEGKEEEADKLRVTLGEIREQLESTEEALERVRPSSCFSALFMSQLPPHHLPSHTLHNTHTHTSAHRMAGRSWAKGTSTRRSRRPRAN